MLTIEMIKTVQIDAKKCIRMYVFQEFHENKGKVKDILEYDADAESFSRCYHDALRFARDENYRKYKIVICADHKQFTDDDNILIKEEGECL